MLPLAAGLDADPCGNADCAGAAGSCDESAAEDGMAASAGVTLQHFDREQHSICMPSHSRGVQCSCDTRVLYACDSPRAVHCSAVIWQAAHLAVPVGA